MDRQLPQMEFKECWMRELELSVSQGLDHVTHQRVISVAGLLPQSAQSERV